jgi:hypothetical protein
LQPAKRQFTTSLYHLFLKRWIGISTNIYTQVGGGNGSRRRARTSGLAVDQFISFVLQDALLDLFFFLMILNKYSLCRRHEQKKRKSWAKMLRLLHFFSPWHSIPLLLPLFDPVVLHQLRLYLRKENGKWKTGRDLTRFLVIFFSCCFWGGKITCCKISFLSNFLGRIYNLDLDVRVRFFLSPHLIWHSRV